MFGRKGSANRNSSRARSSTEKSKSKGRRGTQIGPILRGSSTKKLSNLSKSPTLRERR